LLAYRDEVVGVFVRDFQLPLAIFRCGKKLVRILMTNITRQLPDVVTQLASALNVYSMEEGDKAFT
jgi:uncharacterized Fe-S radical SAM superfamily protein PflX